MRARRLHIVAHGGNTGPGLYMWNTDMHSHADAGTAGAAWKARGTRLQSRSIHKTCLHPTAAASAMVHDVPAKKQAHA